MKFDIWTFLFQIMNFMVLLYILKRILYKPVREIMEKRRAMAAKTLEDAGEARREAEEIREKNRAEQENLTQMRSRLNEVMENEVEEERQRLLEKAALEAQQVMEREEGLLLSRKKRFEVEIRKTAIDAAELFARNICRDISDEKLHLAFYRGFLGEVGALGRELGEAARQDEQLGMELSSAYPLDQDETESLRRKLEAVTGRKVILSAVTDSDVLAGIKVKALDRVYDFSLGGQLAAFAAKLQESV